MVSGNFSFLKKILKCKHFLSIHGISFSELLTKETADFHIRSSFQIIV